MCNIFFSVFRYLNLFLEDISYIICSYSKIRVKIKVIYVCMYVCMYVSMAIRPELDPAVY